MLAIIIIIYYYFTFCKDSCCDNGTCLTHWILPMYQFICSFIQETNIFELLACMRHSAQVQQWTRQMPSLSLHFLKGWYKTKGTGLFERKALHEVTEQVTKQHASKIWQERAGWGWDKNTELGKSCFQEMPKQFITQVQLTMVIKLLSSIWKLELKRPEVAGEGGFNANLILSLTTKYL